ncbi:MAG: hypothetical protein AAF153_00465, partial [Pseudomonadota bacterium]
MTLLNIPEKTKLGNYWLLLAILALAGSGLLSIIIVLLRTPGINSLIPATWFKLSLVVHVDLSVLVWLLAMTAVLVAPVITLYKLSKTALYFAGTGMLLILLSPIFGGEPILNNYVPMLHNFVFVLGLSCFIAGIILQLICANIRSEHNFLITSLARQLGLIMLAAVVAFVWSKHQLTSYMQETYVVLADYYELVFWGFGHILQFIFTQIMMQAWWYLTPFKPNTRDQYSDIWKTNLWLNAVLGCSVILLMPFYNIDSYEFQMLFTNQMRYVGGIAPVIAVIILGYAGYRKHFNFKKWPERYFWLASQILFWFGGVLAWMIIEVNVVIPAHYHGNIIGVSIALMGLAVQKVRQTQPKIGSDKLIKLQPIIITVGQILHITGLAVSGGYGALRKTPGEVASAKAKMAMGMMGGGGMLAVIGGIMLVVWFYQNRLMWLVTPQSN